MNEGVVSTELGLPGQPAAAEDVMVARDILLAELTGAHLHIAHLSTAGAVRLVREAKARGVRVTAEVTPHHLLLTDEAVRGYDPNTKMAPPLRGKRDVEALLEAPRRRHHRLHRHRPRAARARPRRRASSTEAAFGIVGLETAVPLLLDRLVRPGVLDARHAGGAAVSRDPARLLNLPGGSLAVGRGRRRHRARPRARAGRWSRRASARRSRNTPFGGLDAARARPWMTIVGGAIV